MERIIYGALAGLTATTAMTAAMRHLWQALPPRNRYPLPPREIVAATVRPAEEHRARAGALLAHFGFGAFTGALFALLPRRMSGVAYGVGVWAVSYLGWLPASSILRPATRHPPERNLLMIVVHVVWGAVLSASLRELERASSEIFAAGDERDRRGAEP